MGEHLSWRDRVREKKNKGIIYVNSYNQLEHWPSNLFPFFENVSFFKFGHPHLWRIYEKTMFIDWQEGQDNGVARSLFQCIRFLKQCTLVLGKFGTDPSWDYVLKIFFSRYFSSKKPGNLIFTDFPKILPQ